MSHVRLREFNNNWYSPGRNKFWQIAWFFLGAPLVRSSLLPSSNIRVAALRFFGSRIGGGVVVKPGVRVKYPWKLSIGDHSWIGEDCWIDNLAEVCIGSNVCVSQGVYFCTGNHDWSDAAFGLVVRGIELADGSWAGAKAVLAPGVSLGECSIAAAGSVIFKSVPSYEIHAGNPAGFVRLRKIESPTVAYSPSREARPTAREEQVAS